jgi:dolichol-phosphate mannosyltransferase
MPQKEACIVLPALNEEATIGKVIAEIPRHILEEKGYHTTVLVVDNGSTDSTRAIASEKGAKVIAEPRRGKGRAVKTAFEQVEADFVFMLDSDYTYPATYIPEMLTLLEQGYPVVIGSRLKGKIEPGAMSRLNLIGNHILAWLATILYCKKISDLCTGLWGFRGEIIKTLNLQAHGFDFEAELFTQIAKNGYPIAEVPIHYRPRPTEAKLKSLKDGLKIGWRLLTRRFSH